MAFSIIWHHAYNANVYNLKSGFLYWFEKYALNIFDVSVSLFFALSGFLFYQNLSRDNLKTKLLSRVRSLVVPFVVWNVIGFVYFQLLSLFPGLRQYYGGQITSFSVSGFLNAIVNCEYNLVTWFLKTLIIYTFILPIFYPLFKNKRMAKIIFLFSIIMSCYGSHIGSDNLMNISFYSLGMICGVHYKDLVLRRYDNNSKILSLIIFLLIVLLYLFIADIYKYGIFIITRLILIVCIWIFSDAFAVETDSKQWMKYSFVMFVSHEMILEPIEKIIFLLLGHNLFGAVIDYFIAPIISTMIIFFICFILEKLHLYGFLSGGR